MVCIGIARLGPMAFSVVIAVRTVPVHWVAGSLGLSCDSPERASLCQPRPDAKPQSIVSRFRERHVVRHARAWLCVTLWITTHKYINKAGQIQST